MSWIISLLLAGSIAAGTTAPVSRLFETNKSNVPSSAAAEDSERFDQTYPLSPGGRVSVSNVNGSITVETWDRNEVHVEAVKTSDDKERLAEVQIKVDARADAVRVETDYGSRNRTWKNGKLTVDYKISVPRGAVLDEIETVNGTVSIANATNVTKASAVNGQVKGTNLSGTATLSTVNGTVEASFDELSPNGKIELETVNGQVNLTLPSDVNATIKADTVNGSIVNEFGLRVRKGQWVGRDLYGKVGSGDAKIDLSSVNGALNIKRRQDGKSVNPTVDLLPQKDSDRDEYDGARLNRETNRQVQAGMDQARKEMEKARKEMEKNRAEWAKIKPAEIEAQVREALRDQQAALAELSEVGFFSGAPSVEKKGESIEVKGTPTVVIDARTSSVAVRGWDRSEVKFAVTRIRKLPNDKALGYTVDKTESKVTLRVEPSDTDFMPRVDTVRVEVFVPRKSNLRIQSEREIRLENISGEIDLRGSDQSIDVRDSDGKLRVSSADGRIRVVGFQGEVISDNADGETFLEGDFSKLDVSTADGNVFVTLPNETSATIRSNSDVEFVGVAPSKLTEDGDQNVWKVGGGARDFNIRSADGGVIVRSASVLTASK